MPVPGPVEIGITTNEDQTFKHSLRTAECRTMIPEVHVVEQEDEKTRRKRKRGCGGGGGEG